MKSFVRLANTHVKTRRLYYLYEMTKIIDQHTSMTQDNLKTKMIEFSNIHQNEFISYKDPTGEISNKLSFQRYLVFALDMGLITFIEKKIVNTIDGNILSKLNFEKEGPYYLSCSLKSFFLKKLLESDYDYLMILFKLRKLDTIHSVDFVNELENYFKRGIITKEKQDALSRIKLWNSPDKYFRENIYAPRRSWLIDLNIITPLKVKRRSKIHFRGHSEDYFTELFKKSYEEAMDYNKIEYFIHFNNLIIQNNDLHQYMNYSDDIKQKIVMKYLEDAFTLFKSRNRISSKSFLEYYPIYSMCINQFLLEQKELEEELFAISSKKDALYRYRSVTERTHNGKVINAGYITR